VNTFFCKDWQLDDSIPAPPATRRHAGAFNPGPALEPVKAAVSAKFIKILPGSQKFR